MCTADKELARVSVFVSSTVATRSYSDWYTDLPYTHKTERYTDQFVNISADLSAGRKFDRLPAQGYTTLLSEFTAPRPLPVSCTPTNQRCMFYPRAALLRACAECSSRVLRNAENADSAHHHCSGVASVLARWDGSLFQGGMLLPGEDVRLQLQDQEGIRA